MAKVWRPMKVGSSFAVVPAPVRVQNVHDPCDLRTGKVTTQNRQGGSGAHDYQEQLQSVLSVLQAQGRHGVGSELKWRFPKELTGREDSVNWGWVLMQSPYFLFLI